MDPIYFQDQHEFRKWLEENHNKEPEVIVGYYKVKTMKPSMTWSQSVDQAICFGWIDGIRRSIDQDKYCIRFTPRKPNGIWSNINIKKVEELERKGLMKREGIVAFNERKKSKSGLYSFEQESISKLDDSFKSIFKTNNRAWDFYIKQAPSYQKTTTHWIMSAKQETTRIARLHKLIKACENKSRIY